MKSMSCIEQYVLFPEIIPTNRDDLVAKLALREEAKNGLIAERLERQSQRSENADGVPVPPKASKCVESTPRASVVASREARKAAKAVEAEAKRQEIRSLWASWKPSCMEVTGATMSLILIGGGM